MKGDKRMLLQDEELQVRLQLEPGSGIHPMIVSLQIYSESQERWASERYWTVDPTVKNRRPPLQRFFGLNLLRGYYIGEAIEKGSKAYDRICEGKRNSKGNIESALEIESLLNS